MAFLIQPVANLIVSLDTIEREADPKISKEETEKFIQVACRTGLAAIVFLCRNMLAIGINLYCASKSKPDLLSYKLDKHIDHFSKYLTSHFF